MLTKQTGEESGNNQSVLLTTGEKVNTVASYTGDCGQPLAGFCWLAGELVSWWDSPYPPVQEGVMMNAGLN